MRRWSFVCARAPARAMPTVLAGDRSMVATELRDGDYVYRQGDDASEFFVILDGQVQKVVESGDGSKVCLLSCLPAPCPCGFLSVSLCACMPGT